MSLPELQGILTRIVGPAVVAIGLLWAVGLLFVNGETRRKMPGMHGYLLAFATLGVVTGFAAANSRDAILGTVLPALLTVVSALISYLFTKDGLAPLRPAIPQCIFVLSFGALLGLSLGATLRVKSEQADRVYQQKLMEFEHVHLESAKAKYLAELEVWKQGALAAQGISTEDASDPAGAKPEAGKGPDAKR